MVPNLTLKRSLSETGPERQQMPFPPFGTETAFRRLRPAVLNSTRGLRGRPSLLASPFGETLRRRENVRLGDEVRSARGAPFLLWVS